MDIDKLFENKSTFYYQDLQLNQLMLNQMVLHALEDNSEKFNLFLEKTNHYLESFSIYKDYEVNAREGENGISSVELDETERYDTFVQFCIQHLPEKYVLKIVDKAMKEDAQNYKQYNYDQKQMDLVECCLVNGQKGTLKSLLQHQFVTPNHVSNALFLFNYRTLSEVANAVIRENPKDFFDCIQSNIVINQSSRSGIDIVAALESIYNHIDKNKYKKELEIFVEFLPRVIDSSGYNGSNIRTTAKRIINRCLIDGIVEFESKIDETGKLNENKGKSIVQIFNLETRDINHVIESRAEKLNAALKEKLPSKKQKI